MNVKSMMVLVSWATLVSCAGQPGAQLASNMASMPVIVDVGYYDNQDTAPFRNTGHPSARFLEPILSDAVANGIPGIAMLVRSGHDTWAGAKGLIDLRNHIPFKEGSRSRIGSVTKMFTAVVILQLAQEGRLALDEPAARYLPENLTRGIANADTATIRQLLNHSSGVVDYTQFLGLQRTASGRAHDLTSAKALDLVRGHPATFAPGMGRSYSNTGFVLLGLVAEAVTGQAMTELYQQRIFTPLGMNSTYYDPENPVHPGIARGYVDYQGNLIDVTNLDQACRTPDGGIVSTVMELAAFMEALFEEGRLPDKSTLAEMTADMRPEQRTGSYVGLGILEVPLPNSQVMYGHSGGHLGYAAELWYVPSMKLTFAYVANGSKFFGRSGSAFSTLLRRTAALLMNEAPGTVTVKRLDDIPVASVRGLVPSYDAQTELRKELDSYLRQSGTVPAAPAYTVYHGAVGEQQDVEVVQAVERRGTDGGRVKFTRREPCKAAGMVVQGSYDHVPDSYQELEQWIAKHGYRRVGPNREYYYLGSWNETDPRQWLTEIQIPVAKAQ